LRNTLETSALANCAAAKTVAAESAAKTAMAIIAVAPAPAVVESKAYITGIIVTGITITGTVEAAGISVGARISGGNGTGAAVLHSAAVDILLGDGQKGLLALRGVNLDGIDEAEAELILGIENRGTAPGEKHGSNSSGCARSSADGSTSAPIRGSADQSAYPSGGGDGSGVLTMRGSAGGFPKLGENGKLAAVDDGDVGQLDSQFRGALDAASFAHILYFTDEDLAAASYDPAIDDQRLVQDGGELVAYLVLVGGEEVVIADDEHGSRGDG
jgi:hypothetical protein